MPSPTPSQILEQIRSHYLTRLRRAIADHASDGILTVVPEAALRGPDGNLPRRGNPPTPIRVDLITLVDGHVRDGLTIESETMPGFPAFSLRWKQTLPVKISPFAWNACPVRILNAGENVAHLTEWFEHWFDPDEAATPGEDGLLGVVHSMTCQPAQANSVGFLIDLGSAPVEAFEGLIDAIHAGGAESLDIGQP
jgi:hypothetical protein